MEALLRTRTFMFKTFSGYINIPMMLTVVPLSKYQNIAKETNAIT